MNTERKPHRYGSWAWLLAVPPALALLGGMVTMYLVVKHPDQTIVVDTTSEVGGSGGTHQHVVNSVTPPLK